jgi:serine/threonine protein kinase
MLSTVEDVVQRTKEYADKTNPFNNKIENDLVPVDKVVSTFSPTFNVALEYNAIRSVQHHNFAMVNDHDFALNNRMLRLIEIPDLPMNLSNFCCGSFLLRPDDHLSFKILRNNEKKKSNQDQLVMVVSFKVDRGTNPSQIEAMKDMIRNTYRIQNIAQEMKLSQSHATNVLDPLNPHDILYLGSNRLLGLYAHEVNTSGWSRTNPLTFVLEYVPYSALQPLLIPRFNLNVTGDLFQIHFQSNCDDGKDPESEMNRFLKQEWTLVRALTWLRDIAQGLAFLHAYGYHFNGNLSSEKICFTEGLEVKLCAFNNDIRSPPPHAMPYFSPEWRTFDTLTTESDIYSFAVVFVAMIQRVTPSERRTAAQLEQTIQSIFSSFGENMVTKLKELMMLCLEKVLSSEQKQTLIGAPILDCCCFHHQIPVELIAKIQRYFQGTKKLIARPTAMRLAIELEEILRVVSNTGTLAPKDPTIPDLESVFALFPGNKERMQVLHKHRAAWS